MDIILKTVKSDNWDFIYYLRTNKNYKNNFYTKTNFSKEEHYDYLNKHENSPNFFHWIIEVNNQNAGYIRILNNDVSIIIDEKFQSKGIGKKSLELLEKEAKKKGINKLIGRVMIENETSKKIFEGNGYKLLMYWFEKEI